MYVYVYVNQCVQVNIVPKKQVSDFSFFMIYLFHLFEYTVAVFRHSRRGHWIPLQMAVSHHVVAGN